MRISRRTTLSVVAGIIAVVGLTGCSSAILGGTNATDVKKTTAVTQPQRTGDPTPTVEPTANPTPTAGAAPTAAVAQSRAASCAVVLRDLTSFQTEMKALSNPTDETAAKHAADRMVSTFADIENKIGDADVKKAVGAVKSVFERLGAAIGTTPDPSAGSALLQDLQTSVKGLQAVCSNIR